MCGRYALGIRAAFVRYQLQQQGLPVDDAPADDEARETYNFPPGAFGLVYRADVPDSGLRDENEDGNVNETSPPASQVKPFNFQLKAMKWGLIPFWTKRSPDYGSMLRTINCRDDSLIENRGMWTTMKQRKRCLVIAQGFYEWLKRGPGGKDKMPHFVKRKDGQLMCFAGLWDCVKYDDAEEKLYTYTIITTDANKHLQFLHDRMPVILEPNSEAARLWLDPTYNKWTPELQALLKPYEGGLDCYPVSKDVGKVGNNSPDFIIPLDSKENKKNIANFFGKPKVKHEQDESQATKDHKSTEDNAPLPVQVGEKRKRGEDAQDTPRITKSDTSKPSPTQATKKVKSATSNAGTTMKPSPTKKTEMGSQKITNFFGK